MVVRSDIQQQAGEIARAKAAAKECLIAADKFLKDRQFDKARVQVDKARAIDPANPYISAFEERIKIFEQQLKSQQTPAAAPAPPTPQNSPPTSSQPKSVEVPRSPAPVPASPPAASPALSKPAVTPISTVPPRTSGPSPSVEIPAPRKIETPVQTAEPVHPPAVNRAVTPASQSHAPAGASPQPAAGGEDLKYKMDEMSRQIAELSQALVSERRTRDEILKKQLENTVAQFRETLRKSWSLGAPKEAVQEELHQLARSLNLDNDVITSVTREVKLEMYGRAVKEMLAKRKLIRSSSSTMEWLRKVYQVSLSEYLEYESRFLLDLVTDQFRGTLLLVAGSDPVRRDMATRLKSSGFAVVAASTPEEALEKIERVSPTIIVTETQFPGRAVSGVMFLQLLRANSKFSFVPVLLVCDAQEAVTLTSSELREIEGVVKTPVDFDELNAVINEKLSKLRNYISNM